jgi:hypothetical protein
MFAADNRVVWLSIAEDRRFSFANEWSRRNDVEAEPDFVAPHRGGI